VAQLYRNVLHRAPDAAGAQNFINALDHGLSRPDALVAIANSMENRANLRPMAGDKNDGQAARLYQAALNRAPDSAGLSVFSTALSNGATSEQIAHGFVTSEEFANNYGSLTNPSDFATQLYQNVLHRAPDAAGLQNFVNALNAGASRESILLGFSDSTENRINTASLTHDSWVFLR
jgi:serralysin